MIEDIRKKQEEFRGKNAQTPQVEKQSVDIMGVVKNKVSEAIGKANA